jgi:hypothetical protein
MMARILVFDFAVSGKLDEDFQRIRNA